MGKPSSDGARDEGARAVASNARDVVVRAEPRGAGGPEPDELYAVVSVLYHALQGATAYDEYIGDAQKAGDRELEGFFRECRTEEQARARRARALLVARLPADDTAKPAPASSDEVEEISDGR